VVGDALESPAREGFGNGLDFFAGGAIDDAGLVGGDDRAHALVLLRGLIDGADGEREVRPGESADALEGLAQAEHGGDVIADDGRGGGGESDALRVADLFQRLAEAQVVRAEIMAPLAEAVRLVHGEERDFDACQRIEETLGAEAFGRDIDEFVFPAAHAVEALLLLRPGERGVDHGGGDAAGGERVHLVLHQRDERGNHQRHAAETQGGIWKHSDLPPPVGITTSPSRPETISEITSSWPSRNPEKPKYCS
jgi:hypothetical protein